MDENYYENMSYGRAKRTAHVRSGIFRKSTPDAIYMKNHSISLDERVPPEDQLAHDWFEYDPREDTRNAAFDEMPA